MLQNIKIKKKFNIKYIIIFFPFIISWKKKKKKKREK